ncbi:hypothetical protein HU200_037459 [Digitaria exilis]|uniref:Uncharacterized protein n=1 Tax=Digitaria exilis TaxID=1010633 RepID=A0A835BF10_9POAL|nr:hypothetical protein HU200_037459 [Digitaria exilis]
MATAQRVAHRVRCPQPIPCLCGTPFCEGPGFFSPATRFVFYFLFFKKSFSLAGLFAIVGGFSSISLKEGTNEDKRKLLLICFVQVRYMA